MSLQSFYFNPRSPRGERRRVDAHSAICDWTFQSTLPAWGATTRAAVAGDLDVIISIHAPRVGSDDVKHEYGGLHPSDFNPRSPRGERRQDSDPATVANRHFNPRSPRGERRAHPATARRCRISIHAPRVGSDDTRASAPPSCTVYFNPRSPRGERRPSGRSSYRSTRYFNPRSPRGERRLKACACLYCIMIFQSTLPAWGATTSLAGCGKFYVLISIHAPRVGSDDGRCSVSDSCLLHKHFCANRRCADFWLPYHALPADVHFMFDRPSR